MKLIVTILEPTVERAVEAIRAIDLDHDGIEVRAENFPKVDLDAIRAATVKSIIFTRRGLPFDRDISEAALAAGIDLVDVEFSSASGVAGLEDAFVRQHAGRVVLSFHDFDGMPDLDSLARKMLATGAAHVKIAVTPATFEGNERLLRLSVDPRTTVIGMGERGLYSRVLAPFRGSELLFVSPDSARSAAPGQIDLQRALAIYGSDRDALRGDVVFAIAGNPAGHSLSPSIHNPLFREHGVTAAYTIASVATFDELTEPFLRGEPRGLSVTAPFKEEAFRFAQRCGATIGENARECGAVNTLVNLRASRASILADNTDVDGFAAILQQICGLDRKAVAVVGAGGTARAALVALRRASMDVTIYARSTAKAEPLATAFGSRIEPFAGLERFHGDIVIDTTPAGTELPLRLHAGLTVVEAAYAGTELAGRHDAFRRAGVTLFDGLDLLHAQAIRQNALFMKVFDES